MSAIAPCPFCGGTMIPDLMVCQKCGYAAPHWRANSEAFHNAMCSRLAAAQALAEALEPLARAGENWFPQTTDAEPIGYEANHATDADKDALFLTVGHARAAQRALAAWKAAQNSQPAPGAEDTGNV